ESIAVPANSTLPHALRCSIPQPPLLNNRKIYGKIKSNLSNAIEKRNPAMTTPRVAAIHDMSGFGRCSLTVAIPILSAMGIQRCPLPTAFLSTHTGGFQRCTCLDMTDEMPRVAAHWKSLDLRFQAIYSGFLGSERQIGI